MRFVPRSDRAVYRLPPWILAANATEPPPLAISPGSSDLSLIVSCSSFSFSSLRFPCMLLSGERRSLSSAGIVVTKTGCLYVFYTVRKGFAGCVESVPSMCTSSVDPE